MVLSRAEFLYNRSRDLMNVAVAQWPMLVVCLGAVVLTVASFSVRVVDAADPRIGDKALDGARLGIYADVDSNIALRYRPLHQFATGPEVRWDIELDPGDVTSLSASLTLSSGRPLYEVDIADPVMVVAVLPHGAKWDTTRSDHMPDGENCASSYDGKSFRNFRPQVRETVDDLVVMVCKVPAVGKVQNLAFDFRVRYTDQVRHTFGFGRSQSGFRVESSYMPDVALAESGVGYMLRQPMDVRLNLPDSTRVSEAFPDPTGGSAGSRTWRVGEDVAGSGVGGAITGEDIVYRLESPRRRVLIQPIVDLSLLLAGVMFGLAPSFRRGRGRTPSRIRR